MACTVVSRSSWAVLKATKLLKFQNIEPCAASTCQLQEPLQHGGAGWPLKMKLQAAGRGTTLATVCKTQEKWGRFLMITRALRRCLPPVSAQTFLLTSDSHKYWTTASASLSAGCCACCMFCESLGLRWRETVIRCSGRLDGGCGPSFWRVIRQDSYHEPIEIDQT